MTILTFLIFFLLLGILILAHEFGHYIVAVRNGIKAEEFGFGFPPRLLGVVRDDETGKRKLFFGDADVKSSHTIWSVNWIPFGGFVRMKGEDDNGSSDSDSFASKSVGTRIAVLSAGVVMNILLAWILISFLYFSGLPQSVTEENRNIVEDISVQILSVAADSPAEAMGLRPGDGILSIDGVSIADLDAVKRIIDDRLGTEIAVVVSRGGSEVSLLGTPRVEPTENEGALGISFAETGMVRYPWYEAPFRGLLTTWSVTLSVLSALVALLGGLFSGAGGGDVMGPIGIVYVTRWMSELGTVYLLQFAATLSINLAIFNILPIPALDGGRILFVLIEKIKGVPVRETIEQRFHQVGFFLLLVLLLFVTVRDFSNFHIIEKIMGLFS